MSLSIWEQWDKQANLPREAYVELNNEYLKIERGIIRLNTFHRNHLYWLLSKAYKPNDETMREWWESEFRKLPHWFK
jgi:hypothetical protein